MNYRILGATGLRVSEIGFGGWAIGGPSESHGIPLGWGRVSDQDSLAAIRRARELGVNFFDTADVYGYGRSESLMGIVLSRHRDDVVIATKVGNVRSSSGAIIKDFSKRHIFYAVDASLKRLRTGHVDLYQIHNPTIGDLEKEQIQEAMEMLQERGKIRFWGVSISTVDEGIQIVRRGWGYALQVLYNVLNQSPARELFPLARQKNFGIIARVPLASGLLTGKYRANSTFPGDDLRQNFLTPRRLTEALERVAEVQGIVGGAAQNLAEAALRFVLADPDVATAIPGARSVRQVEANAAASDESLPPDVVERLRQRLADYNFYERHAIRV